MMPAKTVSLTAPTDLQTQQQAIERNRKLAEALQQQSMEPLQGQVAPGGLYVPPHWAQGAAKLAQAMLGRYQMDDSDGKQAELSARSNKALSEGLMNYQSTMQGAPEEAFAPAADGMGPTGTRPAVPGNRQAALAALLASEHPTLQQVGAQMMLKEPEKKEVFGKIDPKDYTSDSVKSFSVTGNYADLVPVRKKEFVNDQAVDPYAATPGMIVPKQANPYSDIVVSDGAGGVRPNAPLIQAKKEIASSGAPKTTVTVSQSTEKKYGEQFAGKIADSDVGLRDAAMKAPELAERANRMREILASGKVITGTGADIRLGIGKALNLVGASDGETVANTEALMTGMAQNTLDAIKASGLGAGSGFSNADRDFLEKAAGGKISLEAATINRLSDLAHRSAQKSAERWNTRVSEIPKSAIEGTGLSTSPINVPPAYGATKKQASPVDNLLKKYGG
jgi:hypothetical protein